MDLNYYLNIKALLRIVALLSLAKSTSVLRHEGIVFLFPWRHIVGEFLGEWAFSLFLEWSFIFEFSLDFIVSLEVFSVLLEYFWVIAEILFIWKPCFEFSTF